MGTKGTPADVLTTLLFERCILLKDHVNDLNQIRYDEQGYPSGGPKVFKGAFIRREKRVVWYIHVFLQDYHHYVAEMQPFANAAIGSKPVDRCLQLYILLFDAC